jgi:hypothetical protein
MGRSNALHEFDIAVVPQDVAIDLRGGAVRFPFGRPAVAIECKDVQSAGLPDEMRALIARLYDVTLLTGHAYLTSNNQVNAIYSDYSGGICRKGYLNACYSYRSSNLSNKSVLARTGNFSSGAIAMTAYYQIGPYANISPGTSAATLLFDEVSIWIDANL